MRLLITSLILLASLSSYAGQNLYLKHCASCHTIGKLGMLAPNLSGVYDRHSEAWLIEAIRSMKSMIEKDDPDALAHVAKYGLIMPNMHLTDDEIRSILDYIKSEDKKITDKKEKHAAHAVSVHVSEKQPIDFSHKKHAGDHKIPCMLCHFGARKSRHAGHPPANTCLNCHSQVKTDSKEVQKIHRAVNENKPLVWLKRHDFPDHAYFNHSRHVTAGVSCQTCHGPVEQMVKPKPIKITMGWCIKCHRNADKQPIDLKKKGMPRHSKNLTKLDCARCHH